MNEANKWMRRHRRVRESETHLQLENKKIGRVFFKANNSRE